MDTTTSLGIYEELAKQLGDRESRKVANNSHLHRVDGGIQTWDDMVGENVLDTRDIIARKDELESDLPYGWTFKVEDGNLVLDDDLSVIWEPDPEVDDEDRDDLSGGILLDVDEVEELILLRAILEELESTFDAYEVRYGVILIRDSYFEDYAEQLADDIGAINKESTWPNCHIDWEAAADSLKMDYTSVEIDGIEYWGR